MLLLLLLLCLVYPFCFRLRWFPKEDRLMHLQCSPTSLLVLTESANLPAAASTLNCTGRDTLMRRSRLLFLTLSILSMSIWQDPKVQSCFAFMVVATLGFHSLLLQERQGRKSEWWPWTQETQCQDVLDVIKEMYGHETPAMSLVGHSMGGAVAV